MRKNSKGFAPVILLLIILVLAVGGYLAYNGYFSKFVTISTQTPSTPTSTTKSPSTVVFNLTEPNLKYFTAQISAPANYFATDDTMLEPYDTMGGMAPPRMIFMKDYQVAGGGGDFFAALGKSDHDCVVVESTNGFTSITDWNSIINWNGSLTDIQTINVGNRKAKMYKISKSDGDVFEAFLPIGNSDNTSYFFYTCNLNNESDFVSVIRSIKFRDDLPLN